mmetsp:Transcript_12382/g.13767  ORF Transcript_12382/g.13767 Transcript_12382/m.13767 type:complete len:263 (-) Transcript_12382:387-1175(-)
MRCGVVWQSLVGQSVKFPALWYDGQVDDPHPRPFLGCPSKSNKWSFFGRHRMNVGPPPQPGIANTNTMNSLLRTLVRDCHSSGKLLLHIIVRDSTTFEPTEDLVVGVYHPNAKGIRPTSPSGTSINVAESQLVDQCRDIWIGHRSRSIPHHGKRQATRIESLLHYLNKQSVDKSPLGKNQNNPSTTAEGGGGTSSTVIIPYRVDNTNMNAIYGRTPPKSTVFVPEHKLYQLLSPPSQQPPPPPQRQPPQKPASLVLLKLFLQ